MQNERKQGYLGVRMTEGDLGPVGTANEHEKKWLDGFHPMYRAFREKYRKE
jgi:hypothetical protein